MNALRRLAVATGFAVAAILAVAGSLTLGGFLALLLAQLCGGLL